MRIEYHKNEPKIHFFVISCTVMVTRIARLSIRGEPALGSGDEGLADSPLPKIMATTLLGDTFCTCTPPTLVGSGCLGFDSAPLALFARFMFAVGFPGGGGGGKGKSVSRPFQGNTRRLCTDGSFSVWSLRTNGERLREA